MTGFELLILETGSGWQCFVSSWQCLISSVGVIRTVKEVDLNDHDSPGHHPYR